jgi:hypothetical protein
LIFLLFFYQRMKRRYRVNKRIGKCVVATLLHHPVKALETREKDMNGTTGSFRDRDQLETLTVWPDFALKMLHEVIIDGLTYLIKGIIPSTCSTLLPGISVQKSEEWENGIQVSSDSPLAQLGDSLFGKHSQVKVQAILSIKHKVRMLMLCTRWSGHESIGPPRHHQPLPVRNDPL